MRFAARAALDGRQEASRHEAAPAGDTERRGEAPLLAHDLQWALRQGRWAVLLAELAAVSLYYGTVRPPVLALLLASVVALNLGTIHLLDRSPRRRWTPALVVAADLALISLLAHVCGGVHSAFLALYYLTMLAATLFYQTPGAVVAFIASGAALFLLCLPGQRPSLALESALGSWLSLAIAGLPGAALIRLLRQEYDRRVVAEGEARHLAYERRMAEREMRVAREVQQAILPRGVPRVPGWDLGVAFQPAREVGGDYYYFAVQENRLVVLVADAAGHNVPAALVAALVSQHAPGALTARDLRALFTRWSALLADSVPLDMFVTAACCAIDTDSGEVVCVNAGHPAILHLPARGGRGGSLPPTGPALGLTEQPDYEETRLWLAPGDTLLLYTDGVTDALIRRGQHLGGERLARLLATAPVESAAETVQALLAGVQDVCTLRDDVTLVAVRRAASAPCPVSPDGYGRNSAATSLANSSPRRVGATRPSATRSSPASVSRRSGSG